MRTKWQNVSTNEKIKISINRILRRIIKYLKENQGIVTIDWCENQSIPRVCRSKMEKKGLITSIACGIYINESGDYDDYYFFQTSPLDIATVDPITSSSTKYEYETLFGAEKIPLMSYHL